MATSRRTRGGHLVRVRREALVERWVGSVVWRIELPGRVFFLVCLLVEKPRSLGLISLDLAEGHLVL
jgi:hypothetical protein